MQGAEEIGQIKQIRDKGSPVVSSRQATELPCLHRELTVVGGEGVGTCQCAQ